MRRLAYGAFSFAGGIFAAAYFLPVRFLLLPGIALAAGGIACLFIRREAARRISRILIGAACGLLWFFAFYQLRYAPVTVLDGTQATIRAEVISYSQSTPYGSSVRARLSEEDLPNVKLMVWLDDDLQLRPGDTITLDAKITLSSKPGSDYEDYYPSIGVYLAAAQNGGVSVEPAARVPLRYAHVYIAHTVGVLLPKLFPGKAQGVMAALLTGDKRLINQDPAFRYALQRSGLAHLVAVSGMHVSFLVALVSLLALKRKRLANWLSVPAIVLFMAVTGFSPGVVRAGVMQLFIIAAFAFQREPDPLTSLSAALALLLAVNPFSIKSISLQLSFAATLGLLLFSGKLQTALRDIAPVKRLLARKGKPARYAKIPVSLMIATVSATLCAMVFTVPLGAVYFGSVSLAAPVSNLLALWSVSAAFCFGIIAVPLGALWLPLGKLAGYPAALAARFFIGTASKIGAFGLSAVETGGVYLKIWLVSVYVIFFLWFIMKGTLRRVYLPAGVCAALLGVCLLLSWTTLRGMTVAALDVGQGSCTVLTDGKAVVVVDCGGDAQENAGVTAAKYLRGAGFERIDALVFTHTHADHANGAQVLLQQFDVSCVILPDTSDEYSLDVTQYVSENTELIKTGGSLVLQAGRMALSVFGPVGSGQNEDGLSIVCSYGDFDTVITGDLSAKGELKLMERHSLPDAEVLVVGHHGSKYSTSDGFLQTIRPEIAIISVGADNSYGHPTAEVLERLAAYGIRILRTDMNGTAVVGIG